MTQPKDQPGGAVGRPKVAWTETRETKAAIEQLLDDLDADRSVLTLVFYSPAHDPAVIADVLNRRTGERGVAGSTAGEISPAGFTHGTMVGISFHGPQTQAAVHVISRLSEMSLVPVTRIAAELAERLGRSEDELDPNDHAWIFLVDGLSGREDLLTPFFARYSPKLNLVGGSLADEERFEHVTLVHRGEVQEDAGVIILLEYLQPFEIIHHTHMEFTPHWFEVTKVSEGGRVIEELNGRLARDVYAEALEMEPEDVDLLCTGRRPLGHRFKGKPFPCSIMRPLDNGHFLMAYSVQEHEKLTMLRPVGLVEKSRQAIADAADRLRERGGEPEALLLFNCLGRYIECRQDGCLEELAEALNEAPLIGLNTYGEQFASMHMNHSMTGILFG